MNCGADISALTKAADFLQSAADVDVRNIGDKFEAWIEGRAGDRLDRALGVGLPGKRSVTTLSAIAERDRLIREAAAQFFAHLNPTNQARRLSNSLQLYYARWQRGDNLATECPSALHGSIYAFVWQMLRCRDVPLSARQIRKILAPS